MQNESLAKAEQLCFASIEAGIRKLCQLGVWPRPSAARRLRIGYDFYYEDLQAISEADEFVRSLASNDRISSIYFRNPSQPELHILYDYWIRLLLCVLSETNGILPQKRIFQKWFGKFIKELNSDTALWKMVDTVTGLTIGGRVLKFDGSTSLMPIPGYDLQAIAGKYWHLLRNDRFLHSDWHAGGYDKAIIVTVARVRKCDYAGSHWPYPHLTKQIERSLSVIDAIRLTKNGEPRLHCHAQFHMSHFPLADPFLQSNLEGGFGLHEKETAIERSDFHSIRKLWQELMATKYGNHPLAPTKPTPMDVALGRFSRTYERQDWLDSIVDLTIALESLFGPKDNQELSHRISLRAAWLLGQDAAGDDPCWSSDEVYMRVRSMYEARSARVHGGIPKGKDIRKWIVGLSGVQYDDSKHGGQSYGGLLEAATESARAIVRKAIRACAKLSKTNLGGPHWPLPNDFDKLIVSSKQQKKWQRAAALRDQR